MEQSTALNLTGGWESIVNNVERHNTRVRFEECLHRRKQKKKFGKIVNLTLGAILCGVLGIAGLLAPWIAGFAASLLICIACFFGGQFYAGYAK